MKFLQLTLIFILSFHLNSCKGQKTANEPLGRNVNNGVVGGGCDGCELMYVGIPEDIQPVDTSSGWSGEGEKLVIKGTVFLPGGRSPAENVIIYYWHTDDKGLYSFTKEVPVKARDHGHLRGWVKTGANGSYTIYTIKPASYPTGNLPAHVHFSIKEPGVVNEYYADDINFKDDPLLAPYLKEYPAEDRCGSGIATVSYNEGILHVERNLILGFNIPNYPVSTSKK
jgi:protocatechuate 3,4-dioxygenase, beta subunit